MTATAERTAVVVRTNGEIVASTGALMPAVTIEQMVERYNAVCEFARRVLKPGHDYGVIPGTESKPAKDGETPTAKRNTLLKPGAEKLCTLFGLTPDFQRDESLIDFDRGLFLFSYRCVLLRQARQEIIDGKAVITGEVVGTGIGSSNSREKKHIRISRTCPECGKDAIKRSMYAPRDDPGAKPGWYCHGKAGGCGANFSADDPAILEQSVKINPEESADLINTLQKMGCKRSLVAAVLIATNASELFTQDLDDIEAEYVEAPAPPKQQRPVNNGSAPPPVLTGAVFHDTVLRTDASMAAKRLLAEGEFEAAVAAFGREKGWPNDLAQWSAEAVKAGDEFARARVREVKAKAAGQPARQSPPAEQASSQPAEPNKPAPPGSSKVGPLAIGALERELARVGEIWPALRDYANLPDGTRIQELTLTQHAELMTKCKELPDKK
jgi:hypothetical protein